MKKSISEMIYPKVHGQEIPVHAAKSRMLEIQKTRNVQRLSPCRRVKPQANGGRKILTLLYNREGLEIVCTLGNSSGYLLGIFIRVASYRKRQSN